MTAQIVGLSFFAALLEGIGLGFLFPILELAQRGEAASSDPSRVLELFIAVYDFFNIPFSFGTVIGGVILVMTIRYGSTFLVGWLRARLEYAYAEHLRVEGFENALNAKVSYFDQQGSDEIINAIVTQASKGASNIKILTSFFQQVLLSIMYLAIALYIAPVLTIGAAVVLVGITLLTRVFVESGYDIGDRVAEANERIQTVVQSGTQGIRDVKLFGMKGELSDQFRETTARVKTEKTAITRNKIGLENLYQLSTAIILFGLVYVAIAVLDLQLATLGVFLFTMFRLAPRASNLNRQFYSIQGQLPHALRTHQFIAELDKYSEPEGGSQPVPDTVGEIVLDDVSFSYEEGERIFDGLSLTIGPDEFVALVGPSGAGKSTISSLLVRMYDPDEGEIQVSGEQLTEFDITEWRSQTSVVRQNPHIFNDTLRRNITIGNRSASDEEIRRVCEIAQVTEFLDELPEGFDTVLGDEGVRLSGGQRQRVALARALLKDAELLILDEATSDLDSNIEERVHQAIESMERDYAVLVIAHRLSTVVNADCIYVVEDGAITESGTHRELLTESGLYASLYESQVSPQVNGQ